MMGNMDNLPTPKRVVNLARGTPRELRDSAYEVLLQNKEMLREASKLGNRKGVGAYIKSANRAIDAQTNLYNALKQWVADLEKNDPAKLDVVFDGTGKK